MELAEAAYTQQHVLTKLTYPDHQFTPWDELVIIEQPEVQEVWRSMVGYLLAEARVDSRALSLAEKMYKYHHELARMRFAGVLPDEYPAQPQVPWEATPQSIKMIWVSMVSYTLDHA